MTGDRRSDRRRVERIARKPEVESVEDPWLRPEKAGAHVDYTTNSLKTMRCRGVGPRYVKIGKTIRYRRSDLDEWAARHIRETSDTLGVSRAVVGGGVGRRQPRRRVSS